jgi:hypothetical protein
MALHRIDTAPKTQEFIILQDESALVYEVARWSTEKGKWVREHGQPIQITPTHWMPLPDPACSDSFDGREKRGLRRNRRVDLYAGLCVTAGLTILFLPSLLGNLAGTREKDGLAVHETASQAAGNLQGGRSGSDRSHGDRMRAGASDSMLPGEIGSNVRTSPDSAVPIETEQAGQAGQGSAAHQEEIVERERQRGEALARELVSARQEVQALTAGIAEANARRAEIAQSLQTAEASAIEQRQGLERERQRDQALARELASAREALEAREAAARAADDAAQEAQASARAHQEALDRERRLAQVVARDLTLTREEVKAVEAAAGEAAQKAQTSVRELNDALEWERRRADTLTHQLAWARKEVDELTARVAASDVGGSDAARMQASAAEQRETLERERQRGESLTRELAAARAEVESLTARLATAEAGRAETARVQPSDAEQSEVAAASAELPAQAAQGAHASAQTAPSQGVSPSTTGLRTGVPTASVRRGSTAERRTAAEAAGCLSSAAAVRDAQPEARPKWTPGPNGERCWYAGEKPVFERSPRMRPAERRPDRAAVRHAVPDSNLRMAPLPTRQGFFFW